MKRRKKKENVYGSIINFQKNLQKNLQKADAKKESKKEAPRRSAAEIPEDPRLR